jgi:hypothetical protein
MRRGRESGPFCFAAVRQVKQFEIGKADFGGRRHGRHGLLRSPFAQTLKGLKPAKAGLSGGMDF